MIKTRMMRVVVVSMIIAMLAVAFLAFTASAAPVAKLVTPNAGTPHVVIYGKDPHANFKPTLIHVKVNGQFVMTNKTKTSQTINVSDGKTFTLAPGQVQTFTVSKAGKYIAHLKSNPKATFVVICK